MTHRASQIRRQIRNLRLLKALACGIGVVLFGMIIERQLDTEALAPVWLWILAAAFLSAAIAFHVRERRTVAAGVAHEQLYVKQERTALTQHAIGDAVITTDVDGRVEHMNILAEQLTGWTIAVARARPLQDVFHILDEFTGGSVPNPAEETLREGRAVRREEPVLLVSLAGTDTLVEVGTSPIRDRQGKIVGVVLVFHDVSQERMMRNTIAYQASHDSLTGLVDRREFEKRLQEALKTAGDTQRHHALCYMDLDQFKVVNDTCGHAAGDELLVQLSALLRATVRDYDILARLGGDEFGVLLMDCPLDFAESKAESLRRVVKEFRFVWEGKSFEVGFGIGVVPITANSGSSTDVLRAADAACYAAKSRGRNQIFVYQSDDPELLKRRGEMRWASRISESLENQRFQLYYQIIRPLRRDEPGVFHCELLMRTEDERGNLVSPEAFIPAAERFNLMTDIDRWVVSTALPKIAALHQQAAERGETTLCGINLSGQSLGDESFFDYVSHLMTIHEVPPQAVCFEITETAAIANFDAALRFIAALKARGCYFALDDFGTGMSSFTYLKKLPVDYVKIDGSFVLDMLTNPVDAAMVEAINRIAHVMGIKTIAEFVEDEALLGKLRELGVDYAQGYQISRPAPLEEKLVVTSVE
jgi:diguanylate cyclase (GGDEF)-like protein/PAS domain S-box-containing protein